jgi:riboflavin transporter FmnP
VVVVLLGERFFVLEERLVDFFDVDFAAVPAVFETVLLTVFAGVLLVLFVDAIANIRGAGFLAGLVARTSRIALVCSSSVIRNSWWPSLLATKYRYGTFAGLAAAARLATPGDATGPGGRPLCM